MTSPVGAITYDVRFAKSGFTGSTASYSFITLPSASDATANLLRHSLTESLLSFSMGSLLSPLTVSPIALILSVASSYAGAAAGRPGGGAAGGGDSATGPGL